MAATRFITLHPNRGKTIAQIIGERTDYVKNPDKTDGGELISAYECVPETVSMDFLLSKKKYENIKDERRRNVLAYHIRQSFKPGEITPELANKIGYKLVIRI